MKRVKPFIKWVGGKSQLLKDIHNRMPYRYNNYFEPFVGGGALFFSLPKDNPHNRRYISDVNSELINTYKVVRDQLDELIEDLSKHENTSEYFYNIRAEDRKDSYSNLSNVERASRFIYLNKTCYNGLYRVNKKGQFNSSFGKYKNPDILDKDTLRVCSDSLQSVIIENHSYQDILTKVKRGDFVYFDPPYIPLNPTSSFTSYTSEGFNLKSHHDLRDLCKTLDKLGVKFMLSNSSSDLSIGLYSEYNIELVYAKRSINSNTNNRKAVAEIIVTNYETRTNPSSDF